MPQIRQLEYETKEMGNIRVEFNDQEKLLDKVQTKQRVRKNLF